MCYDNQKGWKKNGGADFERKIRENDRSHIRKLQRVSGDSSMDTENIVNKNVLIQVLEELRRILFPGFFDTNRVRSEYIKYLVGDRMEFVQYHLRKQIARVLGNDETCDQCPKSDLSNKAEQIVEEFFSKIPMIREYLYTDVQAAYDGDPAAYSTDEVIFLIPVFLLLQFTALPMNWCFLVCH